LAKYMAKEDAPVVAAAGVPVGSAGSAGTPAASPAVRLDLCAYWHAVGRRWGVIGRSRLPWAAVIEADLPLGRWYARFKRLARQAWRWSGGRGRRPSGFTLYRPYPEDWWRAVAWSFGA
jgi:hypothetical protein